MFIILFHNIVFELVTFYDLPRVRSFSPVLNILPISSRFRGWFLVHIWLLRCLLFGTQHTFQVVYIPVEQRILLRMT